MTVSEARNHSPASQGNAVGRMPPSWGQPLTEDDYAVLEASWITRELADAAMLRRVDEYDGREIVGQKGKRDCAGILITYYWPGEACAFNHRIRRDNPDWTVGKDGKPKTERKYLGPPNGANRLYIPPGVAPEQLADPQIPIAVVEGEKKALALWRLANHEVEQARFIPIAIAGVWNWRGRTGKTGGPKGERLDVTGPIPDLDRVEWNKRTVFIVFDANVHSNDSVKWARKGICRELATRGAKVDLVDLPPDCGVNGIDDLLAAWGPKRVLELFEESVAGARLEVVLPPQFQARPDGLFRVTVKGGGLTQVPLTNYVATIAANIRIDDGVETKREFEIAAELLGGKLRFTIPASEFARMEWPIERLGAAAITYPNQRDYARAAIQSLSMTADERCIYTHTGWRNLDGHRLYLHAGGAIDEAGIVPDINVRLLGTTSCYELQLPADARALARAVRASLKLADLVPPPVGFSLLAATYRAALGDADFAAHLAGATGAFKSEIAALHQQHYGAGMNRLHLPGSWSSTGNSLEAMAFHAKDALFVIDDFAPQGSSADIARYHAAADRVFRAAGNRAGRGRLDSTARLREPKPPRSLILSTGEDVPRGQSVRARLFILEIARNSVDLAALTERQKEARAGLYAEAMGGFVRWLAGQYEIRRAWLSQKTSEHRARAIGTLAHARTPEIVANLQAGFELFLEFAVDSGAIDSGERDRLALRCWDALKDAAAAQSKHHLATEPAARFLMILGSLLVCGRVHLAARDGGRPDRAPASCGWRQDNSGSWTPQGERVGWVSEEDVYLEPTAAFRAVQLLGRDIGDTLAVTEHTLNKRLHEKGLLASIDKRRQTLTVRRKIGGSTIPVLHLLRSTILAEASDADEDAE